jgi:D-alanine-D-alanine ligase
MTATSFIPQQVRAAGLDIKEVLTDIIEDHFVDRTQTAG